MYDNTQRVATLRIAATRSSNRRFCTQRYSLYHRNYLPHPSGPLQRSNHVELYRSSTLSHFKDCCKTPDSCTAAKSKLKNLIRKKMLQTQVCFVALRLQHMTSPSCELSPERAEIGTRSKWTVPLQARLYLVSPWLRSSRSLFFSLIPFRPFPTPKTIS